VVLPCIDTWTRVDLRTKAFSVPPQKVIYSAAVFPLACIVLRTECYALCGFKTNLKMHLIFCQDYIASVTQHRGLLLYYPDAHERGTV